MRLLGGGPEANHVVLTTGSFLNPHMHLPRYIGLLLLLHVIYHGNILLLLPIYIYYRFKRIAVSNY